MFVGGVANVCWCGFWSGGGGVDNLWIVETSEGWMVIHAGQGVIWEVAGLSGRFRYHLSTRAKEKDVVAVQTTVREFA